MMLAPLLVAAYEAAALATLWLFLHPLAAATLVLVTTAAAVGAVAHSYR